MTRAEVQHLTGSTEVRNHRFPTEDTINDRTNRFYWVDGILVDGRRDRAVPGYVDVFVGAGNTAEQLDIAIPKILLTEGCSLLRYWVDESKE